MAGHAVAANLLMLALLIGGAVSALQIKKEVFPSFALDIVQISVPYPGASPREVETGILVAAEEAVRGIEGVKRLGSTAREGHGSVMVELRTSANVSRAVQDIKNAIDRIRTFPENAERPTVALMENRSRVLSIGVFGTFDDVTLRLVAERVIDELVARGDVTQAELGSAKPIEISVEIPAETLRSLELTPELVAAKIRETAIDMPAGSVKTDGGEVLVRTTERRDAGLDFHDIPIVSGSDGTFLRLGDIATITDGSADIDLESTINGFPATTIEVYRVGDETPISISDAVRVFLDEFTAELPKNMHVSIIRDDSEQLRARVELLLRNAFLGLVLVLLMLGLFLEPRLAFWVMLGIPISIFGSFIFLSTTDASINMISLFAFIVSLGIIVDDAIVIGESIHEKREQGLSALDAAIAGAREMSAPVTFAILTNIVAFMPMLFVPGASARLFLQIPAVAISVFAISLIESLFVLPCHLAHEPSTHRLWHLIAAPSRSFSKGLAWFVERAYTPVLHLATKHHFTSLALGIGVLMVCAGFVAGGRIPFNFLPRIEADFVNVSVRLPVSVPFSRTQAVQHRLLDALDGVLEAYGDAPLVKHVQAVAGSQFPSMGPITRSSSNASNLIGVRVDLVPEDDRTVTAAMLAEAWRTAAGTIPGVETITFTSTFAHPAGHSIDVQLSHSDPTLLDKASLELAEAMRSFTGLVDIDAGVHPGKAQLNFELTPEARSLGLSSVDLARQTRSYLYGVEALRQQRGRNELKVMVRLPKEERRTLHTLETLQLRTPSGVEIPLAEAVVETEGRADALIQRTNGRRINAVTANVESSEVITDDIVNVMDSSILPAIERRFPGLTWQFEGERAEENDSLGNLAVGFGYAMFGIYALLAIIFRSWIQPLIVMSAIPFGIIGAVIGHVLLGYGLSIMSMFGIVALSGVVVNDSLVLIVTTNRTLKEAPHLSMQESIRRAALRRFRPIFLTSVTTFCGLLPMIFETSVQARFLIPMAISIAFGILFATFIILLIVPALFLVIDDFCRGIRWIVNPFPATPRDNHSP